MWTALIVTNITYIKMYIKFSFHRQKIKQLQVFLPLTVTVAGAGISPCAAMSTEGKNKKFFSSAKHPDRIHDDVTGIFY
jgi:hypothetical protein